MSTSFHLGLGFSYLRNSLCLMVVIWMLTEYDFTVVHLFKYIFNVGPSAVDMLQAQRLIWHCI